MGMALGRLVISNCRLVRLISPCQRDQVESVLLCFQISVPCVLLLSTGRGNLIPQSTRNNEMATGARPVSIVARHA